MVRNRVHLCVAVAGLAASLAGCEPVGYAYVAPVYANGYYGGYAVPVYAAEHYSGYIVPVYAGGYYSGYVVPVYAGGYYSGAFRQ